MSFVAVAVGGSALLGVAGASMQSNASRNAADRQASAAEKANQMQWDMYQQNRKDFQPWRTAGQTALNNLQNPEFQQDFTMADFEKDPGYEFRMSEGAKALERSASARGGLNSARTMKELTRYGQGFASNEFNNAYNRFNLDRERRFNRLSSIANMGSGANTAMANAGQNYVNAASGNVLGAANAQGAGDIASANQWANLGGNLGNLGMQYAAYNNSQNWLDQWNSNQQNTPMTTNYTSSFGAAYSKPQPNYNLGSNWSF